MEAALEAWGAATCFIREAKEADDDDVIAATMEQQAVPVRIDSARSRTMGLH
jgi:hypothetical protein